MITTRENLENIGTHDYPGMAGTTTFIVLERWDTAAYHSR
jgi:hypothetical protein